MARFNALIFGLLGFAAVATAFPQDPHTLTDRDTPFTWESWARGIVENPTGVHLTPEQAMIAYNSSLRKRQTNANGATCNDRPGEITPGPAAATCINDLASMGTLTCRGPLDAIPVRNFEGAALALESNIAQVGVTASCGDVAIAAGKIMDACFTTDNTVQGGITVSMNGNQILSLFIVPSTSDLIQQAQ